jgi:ABC-type phosphate transport system permease subunit
MLQFLVKHGDAVAIVVALGAFLLGCLYWVVERGVWAIPIGAVAGIFLYVLMRSYVELVRVIVDMLMPR